jgi:hypothetical protein
VLDRAVAHTLTFVTVAPGCHIRLHSHTNAAAGEDYAHNRRRRTASREIRKLASPNSSTSDLTESGTKLRSGVLHLKVAVVELPYRPRSPG